jgi:hypothetical protein
MARQLQAMIATLSLDPEDYRDRNGDQVGDVPRAPTRSDVAWEIAASLNQVGDSYGAATWEGTGPDRWTSRVALPLVGASYVTDATFGASPRTARTPTLEAAGLRAWLAIELAHLEPLDPDGAPSGATVRFRLWDGTGDLWWSGIEWETPPSSTDWNTEAEVVAAFPELPGNVRALAVVAKLGTTDGDYTPAFYGARVAFGVRQVSAWDDAVIRTLVASLRAELGITGVIEFTTDAETDAIELPGEEWPYDVIGVDAVYDLTEDPDELAELPGAWAAGSWTPTDPIPAAHLVRVEFRYVPDVVARRHQDMEDLARLPAIYLSTAGTPATLVRSQDVIQVRDTTTDPPTAVVLAGPTLVTLQLQLRIIAELGSDTERIAQAVRSWLGSRAYRRLISPETGELVTVHETTPAVESSDTLAQGVAEARASWLLTFYAPSAQTSTTETLVREDGITVTASDPTL